MKLPEKIKETKFQLHQIEHRSGSRGGVLLLLLKSHPCLVHDSNNKKKYIQFRGTKKNITHTTIKTRDVRYLGGYFKFKFSILKIPWIEQSKQIKYRDLLPIYHHKFQCRHVAIIFNHYIQFNGRDYPQSMKLMAAEIQNPPPYIWIRCFHLPVGSTLYPGGTRRIYHQLLTERKY